MLVEFTGNKLKYKLEKKDLTKQQPQRHVFSTCLLAFEK